FCFGIFAVHQTRTVNIRATLSTLSIRTKINCAAGCDGRIPLAAGAVDRSANILWLAPPGCSFLHYPNIQVRLRLVRRRPIRDEIQTRTVSSDERIRIRVLSRKGSYLRRAPFSIHEARDKDCPQIEIW